MTSRRLPPRLQIESDEPADLATPLTIETEDEENEESHWFGGVSYHFFISIPKMG